MGDGRQADDVTVHRLPRSRWWMVAGVAFGFAVSFRQITQPDYNTERRATPDEYLWVVIPALVFCGVLVARMLRSRVETTAAGIRIVGVVNREEIAWSEVAGIEVRPTANRGGFVIHARRVNRRLLKLGTIPGRSAKRREQAEAFAAALDAERRRHLARSGV